jgi:hypothetical protein
MDQSAFAHAVGFGETAFAARKFAQARCERA